MIPLRYNYRSLIVRRSSTSATALGFALVVFVLAASMMLAAGVRNTLRSAGRSDTAIVLRTGSGAELSSLIDVSHVPLIGAAPGVRVDDRSQPVLTSDVVIVTVMDKSGEEGVTNVAVRGFSPNGLDFRREVRVVEGRLPVAGMDEVMVGKQIHRRIEGLALGNTFELRKHRGVRVVGVFEAEGSAYESEVWGDRELVAQAFNRQSSVSSIRVRLEDPNQFEPFRAAVENDKRIGLQALRERDYFDQQSEGISMFVTILGGVVAIGFAAGAMVGAMITMYGAVANRRREISVMRALGFSQSQILVSFLFESLMVSVAGGALGLSVAMLLRFASFSMVNRSSWSEMVFTFDPTPSVLVTALVFACVMGAFGGLLPAVRAARTPLRTVRH